MAMDARQSRDLDNWITGHYGEDQFKDCDDEDQFDDGHMSAHEAFHFIERFKSPVVNPEPYIYDSADDGPEVEIIKKIMSSHMQSFLNLEKRNLRLWVMRDWASREIFSKPFDELFAPQHNYICARVDRALDRIGLR
jgi:hypothetical protein